MCSILAVVVRHCKQSVWEKSATGADMSVVRMRASETLHFKRRVGVRWGDRGIIDKDSVHTAVGPPWAGFHGSGHPDGSGWYPDSIWTALDGIRMVSGRLQTAPDGRPIRTTLDGIQTVISMTAMKGSKSS